MLLWNCSGLNVDLLQNYSVITAWWDFHLRFWIFKEAKTVCFFRVLWATHRSLKKLNTGRIELSKRRSHCFNLPVSKMLSRCIREQNTTSLPSLPRKWFELLNFLSGFYKVWFWKWILILLNECTMGVGAKLMTPDFFLNVNWLPLPFCLRIRYFLTRLSIFCPFDKTNRVSYETKSLLHYSCLAWATVYAGNAQDTRVVVRDQWSPHKFTFAILNTKELI